MCDETDIGEIPRSSGPFSSINLNYGPSIAVERLRFENTYFKVVFDSMEGNINRKSIST